MASGSMGDVDNGDSVYRGPPEQAEGWIGPRSYLLSNPLPSGNADAALQGSSLMKLNHES